MPYVSLRYLDDPSDARIWRYMDVEKLLSILLHKSLFFASGRTLSAADKFEGQATTAEIDSLQLNSSKIKAVETEWAKYTPQSFFFNCWHMNDSESDAMWKLYVNGNGGVAIQSTIQRLKQSFSTIEEEIYLGKIKYIDEGHLEGYDMYLRRYMRKRRAFEHEREIRAIFYDKDQKSKSQPGVLIATQLDVLIERIVIAPRAEGWFGDIVKSIVSKLGYQFEVVTSDAARPLPSEVD